MDVTSINTYAGSLLLGARSAGFPVRVSLEDTKFGVKIQEANFPDLDVRVGYENWPDLDLKDSLVIAHPPCSAFSVQNNTPGKRGLNAPAFACTVKAVEYAARCGAPAIAVESVKGALEGARTVHDELADKWGYNVYRILLNSISYGLPQWRERFWVIFTKTPDLNVSIDPEFRNLAQTIDAYMDGPRTMRLERRMEKLRVTFLEKAKMDLDHVEDLLAHNDEREGLISKYIDSPIFKGNPTEVWQQIQGGFISDQPRLLRPEGYAPTVMHSSFWYYRGQVLRQPQYKAIMGFPPDYEMPESSFNMYLSKGVCPPIAAWILTVMKNSLTGVRQDGRWSYTLRPGQTVSMLPRKGNWWGTKSIPDVIGILEDELHGH